MTTFKGNKLTRRNDGRWVYTKTIDGKRTYFYGKTQQDLISKIKKGTNKKILPKNITENLINEWYKSTKEPNISELTKEIYNNTLNNYIRPFFKSKNINNVTLYEIQSFINNIDKERTREFVYQHIKSIFRYALATQKIKVDITQALILPRRKNKIIRKSLTIAEQKILLNSLQNNKLKMFIIFSLVIGTRRNETLAFDICDINEEKLTLHIKGTKTETADRTIKLSQNMIELLKKNNKTKPYFNFTPTYVTKGVKKIFKNLNMEHCVHSLRHTCSTNLYYLGAREKERQNILGHKSITTTNDIYTNLELDVSKDDVIKLYNNLYPNFDNVFDNTFLEK